MLVNISSLFISLITHTIRVKQILWLLLLNKELYQIFFKLGICNFLKINIKAKVNCLYDFKYTLQSCLLLLDIISLNSLLSMSYLVHYLIIMNLNQSLILILFKIINLCSTAYLFYLLYFKAVYYQPFIDLFYPTYFIITLYNLIIHCLKSYLLHFILH